MALAKQALNTLFVKKESLNTPNCFLREPNRLAARRSSLLMASAFSNQQQQQQRNGWAFWLRPTGLSGILILFGNLYRQTTKKRLGLLKAPKV